MKLLRRRMRPLTLETERFLLRGLSRRQAAKGTYAWSRDPQVMAGFNETAGAIKWRRWVRRFKRYDNVHNFGFGIWPREGGEMIGFHSVAMPKSRDSATLAVMVGDQDWWGRGVVAEVRAFLVDWLFLETPVHRIAGMVHSRNFPSIFNYKKLGFVYEGAMREQAPWIEGGRVDLLLFSLLKPEWQARRAGADTEGTGP